MKRSFIDIFSDRVMAWVGSTSSIIFHTLFFGLAFASHWLFRWPFEVILLVLTTIVSLEAIYLAIFIQRAVNQQGVRLDEVEETLDDVEESIDEIEEDTEDIEDIPGDTIKGLEKPLHELLLEMQQSIKEMKALMRDQKKSK